MTVRIAVVKTLTFVRMLPGIEREEFYRRWCEHTRDLDLRDHPEISLNRLILFDEGADYAGLAENHWPDQAAVDAAIAWYETPAGIEHNADLASFMDIANSPTVVVGHEVEVSKRGGVEWKTRPVESIPSKTGAR